MAAVQNERGAVNVEVCFWFNSFVMLTFSSSKCPATGEIKENTNSYNYIAHLGFGL